MFNYKMGAAFMETIQDNGGLIEKVSVINEVLEIYAKFKYSVVEESDLLIQDVFDFLNLFGMKEGKILKHNLHTKETTAVFRFSKYNPINITELKMVGPNLISKASVIKMLRDCMITQAD